MQHDLSILIRVDGDGKIGLGHMSRCRSLMYCFSMLKRCLFTIMTQNGNVVKSFIHDLNFALFDAGCSLEGKRFDLAIVDVPGVKDHQLPKLQRYTDLIVCIDDEGQGVRFQDILIRPNLLDLPKPSNISHDKYWTGRDYIILHPNFMEHRNPKKNRNSTVEELLVCFGGSDPQKLTLRVIPIIKKIESYIKIHIVIGSVFSWKEEVISAIKDDSRFLLSQNISNMAMAFRNVNMAMTSGGTLLYEGCSLGVPMIIISQNTSQNDEASICHDKGAVINIGLNETLSDDSIWNALNKLIKTDSLREALSKKGPKIVAADASLRIASKLISLVKDKL